MNRKLLLIPVILTLLLCGSCGGGDNAQEFPVSTIEISRVEFHTTLPSGLTIAAYELAGPPTMEPMLFVPVTGVSQDEILVGHQEERLLVFPDNSFHDDMSFNRAIPFGEGQLTARQTFAAPLQPDPGSLAGLTIEVLLDDEVIYSADAGSVSPLMALQGLWQADQDWVLEYAHVTVTFNESDNTATSEVVGQVVRSGESLNEKYGLEETFGYQTLREKPFYFFKMDGRIGVSYDGTQTMLGFEEVPHYGCCSAAILNPRRAENMVSFFAQTDGIWYYVEVGVYD